MAASSDQYQGKVQPRITVVGVGGGGGNAVNNMIAANLDGVDFLVTNTDGQALEQSLCDRRLQLGRVITEGLGAGAKAEHGRAAAEEVIDEIIEALRGSHMVFVAAGMGGGTGTGAAPVIARAARELGILTVGVVTKPFQFEGAQRMRTADVGVQELQEYVDTLIVIPNQNLFRIANENTTLADAFKMADDVLYCGVRGITDLIVNPGVVNLDFADIRTIMSEMGKAMMGTGEAEGEKRALDAAEAAISNPLLDEVSMKGARAVLVNITGGLDIKLYEVDEAAQRIKAEVDDDANIIWGSAVDPEMEGRIRVSVVATGMDSAQQVRDNPNRQPSQASVGSGFGGGQPAAAPTPRPPMSRPAAQSGAVTSGLAGSNAMRAPAGTRPASPEAPVRSAQVAAAMSERKAADVARRTAMAAGVDDRGSGMARRAPEQRRAPEPMPQEPLLNEPQQAPGAHPSTPQPQGYDGAEYYRDASAGHPEQIAPMPQARRDAPQQARGDDAFIAPPPARPTAQRGYGGVVQAPPRGEAPAQSGGDAAQQKPRQSLFERVVGGSRGAPQQDLPPQAGAGGKPRRAPEQPRLGGLDPADRSDVASGDDSALEIPAFLRRQAN